MNNGHNNCQQVVQIPCVTLIRQFRSTIQLLEIEKRRHKCQNGAQSANHVFAVQRVKSNVASRPVRLLGWLRFSSVAALQASGLSVLPVDRGKWPAVGTVWRHCGALFDNKQLAVAHSFNARFDHQETSVSTRDFVYRQTIKSVQFVAVITAMLVICDMLLHSWSL